MKKKISLDDLIPGMFIADLNCGWLDHPFASTRFLVRNTMTISKIRALGIEELWIDTSKGRDVPRKKVEVVIDEADKQAPPPAEAEADVASQQEVEKNEGQKSDLKVVLPPQPVPLGEEIRMARRTHHEASQTITNMMNDIRMGRSIKTETSAPIVERMTDSIFRNQNALLSLGRIRNQDQYTFQHSVSVSVLMMIFAKSQGYDIDTIHHIGQGALLHDIGKVKVPNEILNKPGKLTDEEFAIMKQHATYSGEILSGTPEISPICVEVAAQHHERWDGSGYPKGLKGDQISPYAQMAAVADVYDAITSDRCYHKGQHPTVVLRRLLEWSEQHFCPSMVQRFIQCVGIYPPGTLVRLKSGKLAVVMESASEKDGRRDLLHPVVRAIFCTKEHRYMRPEILDLSCEDVCEMVVGSEDPKKWGINIDTYIGTK
ncbi:HD-GYP domain-containing protein [Desulfurispirillum indicum]|uniref:HD-GYP domain-containing protein n=1 Tax=Desulfurispirillum indicum TaxID=936456 RepID=UPI001CFA240D|nr:HD-GYP domain-containing protein [Desulfurispirillum indicum]UCZ57681.1 HD-GYP domain-containing protein [Desulfurispirillum indicum]